MVFGTASVGAMSLNFTALGLHPMPLTDLNMDITDTKITMATKELPTDRALGPDGFTGKFYKTSWNTIQTELMAAV